MKMTTEKPEFRPITITLESEEEFAVLDTILDNITPSEFARQLSVEYPTMNSEELWQLLVNKIYPKFFDMRRTLKRG